ncbi:MAG: lysylphosphatidylglycerol synthase transmembrane domain-containing protein [Candidatus Omnitrophica bacterium]|nr:lysylphosphatidylglycerol synthase transmembrane domain-containing protein [Candidatus Omnitrophota bacterium]
METFKKVISIFIRVGVSIALLVFLFEQVDKKSLFVIIKNANKPLLFSAFLVFFLIYVLCLLRWEMLLKAVKIHLPLKRIIISFAGGVFFSLFLPSTIGGDFMRSIDLATHTQRPKEVIATVFLDRLSGYIGLVILTLLAVSFGWNLVQDSSILISLGIIVAILFIILIVLFNTFIYAKINKLLLSPNAGRLRDAIKNLHEEIHVFRHKKRVILNNLFLSLIVQAIPPLTFYIIALSLGIKMNIIYFFVFLPIIGAITLLPISIGGLGLRDATTIYFFAKVGVSKDLAFAMSLLSFSFVLIYGVLGGLIYVLTVHHRRLQHHPSSGVRQASQ